MMKPLPYQKVEAYKLGNDLHATEKEALLAAVEKILGQGPSATAIQNACALAPLLERVCELEQPAKS